MTILQTLRYIYWDSTRPIRLITVLLYPLAAAGLYLSWQGKASDVHFMFHLVPGVPDYCHAWAWGLVVSYIFIARVVGLFFWKGLVWTRRTTPMLGVIFWSMLLASNLHDPNTLAFGTLYGVAALIEAWILSRAWLE